MSYKRVLSGIQPTGNLHLGNYLGAIKNFIAMQKNYECFYMLADLHAITVKVNPKDLKESIFNTAATFLASGLDSKKNTIFVQKFLTEDPILLYPFFKKSRSPYGIFFS